MAATNEKEKKTRAQPEIIEHIAVLRQHSNGWTKEINIVSWNGDDPVVDIRSWSKYHRNFGRGVSFDDDELDILSSVINNDF